MTTQQEPRTAREGNIPAREQINRLLRQTSHISRLLAAYQCEPRTEREFLRRAALRQRLQSFERQCSQGADRLAMARLIGEFKTLEADALQYIREVQR